MKSGENVDERLRNSQIAPIRSEGEMGMPFTENRCATVSILPSLARRRAKNQFPDIACSASGCSF